MASVIPQLNRVWRNSHKFLQFSVPFQNSDSMHLQPEVSRQLKLHCAGFPQPQPLWKTFRVRIASLQILFSFQICKYKYSNIPFS